MSCNYYRGKCLFLNGKEDGCKGCPIKKAYRKGVRDAKRYMIMLFRKSGKAGRND